MGFKLNSFLTGALNERSSRINSAREVMLMREEKMRDFFYRMAPLQAQEQAKHNTWNTRFNEGLGLTDGNKTLAHMYANDQNMSGMELSKTFAQYKIQTGGATKTPVSEQTASALEASATTSPEPAPGVTPMASPTGTNAVEPVVKRSLVDSLFGNTSNEQIDQAIFSAFGQEFGTTAQEAQGRLNKLISGEFVFKAPTLENPEVIPPPLAGMDEIMAMANTIEWKDMKGYELFLKEAANMDTDAGARERMANIVARYGMSKKEQLDAANEGRSNEQEGWISQTSWGSQIDQGMSRYFAALFRKDELGRLEFTGGGKQDEESRTAAAIRETALSIIADTHKNKAPAYVIQEALRRAFELHAPGRFATPNGTDKPVAPPKPDASGQPGAEKMSRAVQLATKKLADRTQEEQDELEVLLSDPDVIKIRQQQKNKK
jgi:hypothetical protein